MDEVEISNRQSRFHQTNALFDDIFPESDTLDTGKIQLVVSRWAFYLLDEGKFDRQTRKVILSSDGESWYQVQLLNRSLKKKRQGDGIGIRRIFDITETTLEAALAIIIAQSYPVLREEQIKVEHREILANYGYMVKKDEEYFFSEEKLAA